MAVAVLVLLVAAAPPHGEQMERARAQYEALEFDEAVMLAEQVAMSTTASAEQRVAAHLLAGMGCRIVGRDVDARLHFETALRLNPRAALPADTPPKITGFFSMIRAEVAQQQPAATREPAPPPPPPPPPAPAGPVVAPVAAPEEPSVIPWVLGASAIVVVTAAIAGFAIAVATWGGDDATLGTIDTRDPASLGTVGASGAP